MVSSRLYQFQSSPEICINPLLGPHAVLRTQSKESGKWLIHSNWWMMIRIWNQCPRGMAPPPLLPSECHPRLICTNLINTLTGTPGLVTEESAATVKRTHQRVCMRVHACCPDGPLIAPMVTVEGWWLHLTRLLLTHVTTLIPCCTHSTKCVPLWELGYVVIGDNFSPQYTSNCSLNDTIRLWSDSAPDWISTGLWFLLQLTKALNPTLTPISPTFIRES